MKRSVITVICTLLFHAACGFAQNAPASAEVKTGKFFAWCEPPGWKSIETSMGVEIWHPDGFTMASSAVIRGDLGMSAGEFIQQAIATGPTKDIQVTDRRVLNDGTEEWTGTFTYNGRRMCGVMSCKVFPKTGILFTGFQAPVEVFERAEPSLRKLVSAVRVISEKAGVLEEEKSAATPANAGRKYH